MNRAMPYVAGLVLFFILSKSSFSQVNVAINGSFEEATKCPDKEGDLEHVTGYYRYYNRTSDFFSGCGEPRFGVPNNGPGNQQPIDGYSYAGIMASTTNYYWFDYIVGTLDTSSMIDGKEYCISLRVSLAENSPYAINELGIFFSPYKNIIHIYRPDGRIYYSRLPSNEKIDSINYITPSAKLTKGDAFLDDTEDWVELRTTLRYTQNVDAHFWIGVLPGNSLKRKSVNSNQSVFNPENTAYYYIDDIKIIEKREDTVLVTPQLEYACEQPRYRINNLNPGYNLSVKRKDSLIQQTSKDLIFSTSINFDSITIQASSEHNCHTINYQVNGKLDPIKGRNFNMAYPNPTSIGEVNIDFINLDNYSVLEYHIHDQSGRLIKKGVKSIDFGFNSVGFDVTDLEIGVYYLKTVTSSCSKIHQIVVKN